MEKTEKWISVKTKLPRHGKKVLVLWKDYKRVRHIDTASIWRDSTGWHFRYYDVDGANELDDSQVTHWTQLIPPITP